MMTDDVCQEMLAVLKEILRIWNGPHERAGIAFMEAMKRAEAVIARAEEGAVEE
jgi:hypothetical protein